MHLTSAGAQRDPDPRAPRPGSVRVLTALAVTLLVTVVFAACGSGPASPSVPTAPSGSVAAGDCPTNNVPQQVAGWDATAKAGQIIPQIVSSDLACGKERLLFGFTKTVTDSAGAQVETPAGGPQLTAKVAFYDLGKDPTKPVTTVDASFMWAIEGTIGIYVTNVNFTEAGDWGAEFTTSDNGAAPQTIRLRFQVQPTGSTPQIGQTVPSVKTATAASVNGDLKEISTDPTPDPAFYQLSEDQALAQHKPFVLIFATPAFCTSRICGPTLDKLKADAPSYPNVAFINTEPYLMTFANGHLQPNLDSNGQLQANAATTAFNIPTEPWIFVVGADGRVTGSFETLVGPDELKTAIAAATKS